MPNVSVLIPAFRAPYLDLAIASALAQSYTDFELLISDDSSEEFVASVVSKWDDPRIRFCRNPNRQVPGANRDHLLGLAQGKYIKFLFDDDYLLPQSINVLVEVAEQSGSQLVFHGRHIVDECGCIVSSPLVISAGKWLTLERRAFFEGTVGSLYNFIGEPSNILFEAEAYRSLDRPFELAGIRMRFLTDMALYINFAAREHKITGVGLMGSAFRKHAQQTSNTESPGYSAGLFEWEFCLRWAVDHGELSVARYASAWANLPATYRKYARQFPELVPFIELNGRPGPTGYLSDEFRELANLAYMTIELRRLALMQGGNQS